jgi:hypothetical protein
VTSSPKISSALWFDKEAEAGGPDDSLKVAFSYKQVSPQTARPHWQRFAEYLTE